MRINRAHASILLLPLLLSCTFGGFLRHPKITVPGVGRLKGTYLKSEFTKRSIDAYYGIPYGKSTEGERRFAPPQPADPLNQGDKNYDATLTHYTLHPSKIVSTDSLLLSSKIYPMAPVSFFIVCPITEHQKRSSWERRLFESLRFCSEQERSFH